MDEYDDSYKRYIRQTADPQKTVTQYFNELQYIGYFEDGDYEGKGNLIEYPDRIQLLMAQDEEFKQFVDTFSPHLDVITGEFKNGEEMELLKYTQKAIYCMKEI